MTRAVLSILLVGLVVASDSPMQYDDTTIETNPQQLTRYKYWWRTVWVGKEEYLIGLQFREGDRGQFFVKGPIVRVQNQVRGGVTVSGFRFSLATENGHPVIQIDNCLEFPEKATFLYEFKDGSLILRSGNFVIKEGKKMVVTELAGKWKGDND